MTEKWSSNIGKRMEIFYYVVKSSIIDQEIERLSNFIGKQLTPKLYTEYIEKLIPNLTREEFYLYTDMLGGITHEKELYERSQILRNIIKKRNIILTTMQLLKGKENE